MKKWSALIVALLSIAALTKVAVWFAEQSTVVDYEITEPVSLYAQQAYKLSGYDVDGDAFTPNNNDPQIGFYNLSANLQTIGIDFSKPLDSDVNIEVYYAVNGEGLSQANCMSVTARAGSDSAVAELPYDAYTSLRLDINGAFCLKDIVVSEEAPTAVTQRQIDSADIFAAVVCALFVLACGGILYLVVIGRGGIEKITLLAVLLFGSLYLLLITPISGPDEPHHYQSAYKLSNYMLLQWGAAEYGDSADFDYEGYAGHQNVASGYRRIVEDFWKPAVQGEQIVIPLPRSLSYPVEYFPQAFGIALSRLTNQNFIRTFLFGRLCNLLFYAACVYCAVKRTPKFKALFALISICPMALHQAASYSYDAFVNGMALLLIAEIVKCVYEEGPLPKRDFLCLFIVATLLAPAKVVYGSLALLIVLIPSERFGGARKKAVRIGAVFASCALFLAVFQHGAIALQTGKEIEHYYAWQSYSVSYILKNPRDTLSIFAHTLSERGLSWLEQSVGILLSGLSLPIPRWIIELYLFAMALSTIQVENTSRSLSVGEKSVIFVVAAIATLLTMLSMFCGWTQYPSKVIQGVQGRYFIPMLPLLFMLLNNRTIISKKSFDKGCISAALALNLATAFEIARYTCVH